MPKIRHDDGRWSQQLYIQYRCPTGGKWVGWVKLTFSKEEGYGIVYDGDRPGLVQWLEGICGNGMLWALDEWVNGRPEQNIDQTDAQLLYVHGEADDA